MLSLSISPVLVALDRTMLPALQAGALLQGTDLDRRAGDVVQNLTAVGVAALVALAFKINGRITRIETVLTESELGVIPRLTGTSRQVHGQATVLQEHEIRLDRHDTDIERIEIERRGGSPGRRAEDRR